MASAEPGRAIRLLATDLDGTLLGEQPEPAQFAEFRELLLTARRRWRTRWAIITGRNLPNFESVVPLLLQAGLFPDYIVLEDAHIYRFGRGLRLRPFRWWNFQVNWRRARMLRRWHGRVREWHDELAATFPNVNDYSRSGVYIWLSFESSADASQARAVLTEKIAGFTEFLVFRWGREVALLPKAGSKGEAVLRLRRELGVPARETFAIGDGPNDVSMLDGQAAGIVACVANAEPEVQAVVTQAGGAVAAATDVQGVVEILSRFVTDGGRVSPAATTQPHDGMRNAAGGANFLDGSVPAPAVATPRNDGQSQRSGQ